MEQRNLDIQSLTDAISNLGIESEELVPVISVQKLLLQHETCESWANLLPLSENELEIVLQTVNSEFEDFAHRTDENETDLRYSAVEMVTRRCIQAYIYLRKKLLDEVESILTEAYQLIQYCLKAKYFSFEYEEGFRYVVRTLELSLATEMEANKDRKQEVFSELKMHLESYEQLSVQSQVGVLAMKQYFLGNLYHGAYNEQIEVARKMVSMDPDCTEWHYCLHLVERYKREALDKYGPVTEAEKQTILRAMKCPTAMNDPRVLNGYVSCIADIVRIESRKRPFRAFTFGEKTFNSLGEAVLLIRLYSDTILATDPMSVRSNVNIAKIFSSVLPNQYRDKDFARACLKRAIMFRPTSSKANHRLGVLYLTGGESEKALKYLLKAYEADKRNFFALLDVLNILLGDVEANDKKIMDLFDTALDLEYFKRSKKNYASILLLKGLHEYLISRKKASLDYFLKAYLEHEERSQEFLVELRFTSSRFKWERNLSGSNLLSGLRDMFFQEAQQSKEPTRRKAFTFFHEAAATAGGRRAGPGRTGGWQRRPTGNTNDRSSEGSEKNQHHRQKQKDESRQDYKEKDSRRNFKSPPSVSTDPYIILGIARGSSKSEIKAAYFAKAREYHPDKNKDLSEEERLQKQEEMKRINKAWECLQKKY